MSEFSWSQIIEEQSVDTKALLLQDIVLSKVNIFLPEKTRKIESDDQAWVTNKKSAKYILLNEKYQQILKDAKKKLKRKTIDVIKTADKSKWYSKLKWISSYDQHKTEQITVEEINHLSDAEQAEAIADGLSAISNEFSPLQTEDIVFPPIPDGSTPQLSLVEIQRYLENIKTNKSTVMGDIPAIIIKECAQYLCIPLRDIINNSITSGHWARTYKKETITPIPKVLLTQSTPCDPLPI